MIFSSSMAKRLPHAKRPRAMKPMRSASVTKAGGVPYTPVKQQRPSVLRNQNRSNQQTQGQSTPHDNSLVALLSLSLLALGKKLRTLGFLKEWKHCPRCGGRLSELRQRSKRLYYYCTACAGKSSYISCLHGSILAKGLRLSLRQLTSLLVCFSENIAPMQSAQLCGVSRKEVCRWFARFRCCIVRRMMQIQKSMKKQGGVGIISEADEASISSGPVPTPANKTPRFSFLRIIALLVRGSRNLIIEKLPMIIQKYRLKGNQKTMSGGTITFKGKKWVPPGPPPLSKTEGQKFLKKYYKGGILSTDSAETYNVLINIMKICGRNSQNVRVVHGNEEWAKLFSTGVWGGTQYMDGFFGNWKQFAKVRHIRRHQVMDFVREYQYWFVMKKKDRLEAFADACSKMYH